MPQAKTTKKQLLRSSILLGAVNGFGARLENPAENLVEFVKFLDNVEITQEKIDFNGKYMRDTNGSIIEY